MNIIILYKTYIFILTFASVKHTKLEIHLLLRNFWEKKISNIEHL